MALGFSPLRTKAREAMNGVELIRVIHDVLSIVYTIGKVVYRFCNDIHGSARKPARKCKRIRRKRR